MHLINYIKYIMFYRKVNKMPIKDQIKIGKEYYTFIANELAELGESKAVSSIIFECPFSGHISRIENYVLNKLSNNKDPLSFFKMEELGNSKYILSIGVFSKDDMQAQLLADALCMVSITQVNTIKGDFSRIRASVPEGTNFEETSKALNKALLEA